MKNLNTLTKALTGIGIIFIVASIAWHILYPDWSQLVITLFLSFYCLGFAYMCEFTRKMREENHTWKERFEKKYDKKFEEIDNVIRNVDEYMKKELKEIKEHS